MLCLLIVISFLHVSLLVVGFIKRICFPLDIIDYSMSHATCQHLFWKFFNFFLSVFFLMLVCILHLILVCLDEAHIPTSTLCLSNAYNMHVVINQILIVKVDIISMKFDIFICFFFNTQVFYFCQINSPLIKYLTCCQLLLVLNYGFLYR